MLKLNGLRVLNTRPVGQSEALNHAIEAAGGVAIALPALAIEPVMPHWVKTLPPLGSIQQAIFISANAVKFFFEGLISHKKAWPKAIVVIAIGEATSQALSDYQICVDIQPKYATSESMLNLDAMQQLKDQTILLVKGEGGRAMLATKLNKRGAHVLSLPVYRRTLPQMDSLRIMQVWQENTVDIIVITSVQSLRNIFALFGKKAYAWLCTKPCVVISERIAEVATELGMQTIIVSAYDAILPTLAQFQLRMRT